MNIFKIVKSELFLNFEHFFKFDHFKIWPILIWKYFSGLLKFDLFISPNIWKLEENPNRNNFVPPKALFLGQL
jgi:hypothetical protein